MTNNIFYSKSQWNFSDNFKFGIGCHYRRILICLFLFFKGISFSSTEHDSFFHDIDDKLTSKEKKIAICYFGLTRSTKHVYQSHYEHIFNVLNHHEVSYDVFMHTWDVGSKQRIWNNISPIPVDYNEYLLLNPNYYQLDIQDEFTDSLDFSQYFYQKDWVKYGNSDRGEWIPELVLNHLCALESQKRVTEMVYNSGNDYDLIMYVRPDTMILTPLPLDAIISLQDNEIVIPNFDHYEGYNDRFAVLTFDTAPLYGKRIDNIIEFRKTRGRIVSEKYVKYTCQVNGLKVIMVDFFFKITRP